MDFQKLLLDAGKALCKDEVKALAFLCTDLLGRNPASVESASDLFSRLVDQDHLCAERPHLLSELLSIINRKRLARDLGLPDREPTIISSYRVFLYSLSEDLTTSDLKDLKFLLRDQLPRRKLEENVTTLEVFLEMEHMDLINDTDLNLLEDKIRNVCPMLVENFNEFKTQQVRHNSYVAQETSRPRSETFHFGSNQIPQPLGRTCSNEMPTEEMPMSLAESTMHSSNTSMDFLPDFQLGLSNASIQTSGYFSNNVRNDAVVSLQENQTSSGMQMSPTTNTNTVLETYPMTAVTRGICLIINNYDFTKSLTRLMKRDGTMIDKECLEKVFKWLGFKVEVQKDCTCERMLSVMKELGGRNHSQMDSLVCCILSHGQEGSVYGVDGKTVTIRKLMEPFNGLNCSSLAGKPKLFFIQACQGKNEQAAVYLEADGPVLSDAIEATHSIPSDADFLLGMSTVPSFVSYREKKNGTWFIQSLCQHLVQNVPRSVDLVSILTIVNSDVSRKTDSTGVKKQMPQPAFSLTKKVVFPIPAASSPVL
ncbi:caspase-8 isoform X1 [Larimichthys crocea]|uniref:caspase-8 isoform X1 n=1 Tax=Larimichthys crocea TaxID=215358 RepID=UPI000F5EA69F|nr:caspase-8-like isoform X1 [Larimichthys crocea]